MSEESTVVESDFSKLSRLWQLPILLALAECLTHFGSLQGDSSGYIDMVKLFRGVATPQEAQVYAWHGMLRPIVPFLSIPVSYVVDYPLAIATVSTAFILVGTFAVYMTSEKLFGAKTAFIAAISFASAIPVLTQGAAVLSDGAGYGMLAVLTYMGLFMFPQKQTYAFSLVTGIMIALGVLTKETNLLVLILIWIYFFANKGKLRGSSVLIVTVVALGIALTWAQAVGQSYLGFYGQGLMYHNAAPSYAGPLLHPRQFLLTLEYAFGIGLAFAILGFFSVDDDNFKLLLELLIATAAVVLLWPTPPEDRLTFLLFPAIIPLAAFGITKASNNLSTRPVFRKLSDEAWLTLFSLLVVLLNNLSGLRVIRLP